MRKFLIGAALVAGLVGAGYYVSSTRAMDRQVALNTAALDVASSAIHAVNIQIDGGKIRISGLADSETERDALISALGEIDGHSGVLNELTVLPKGDPFTIAATRKAGQTLLQGNVPTEAMRTALAQTGAAGVEGLILASGAPERWESAIGAGLATLSQMDEGSASLTGTKLRITGLLETASLRDSLIASLTLPEGYTLENEIETRDENALVAFDLHFDAAKGVTVEGALPKGLDLTQIGEALGVTAIQGEAEAATGGEPDDVLTLLSALKTWLPELETAKLSVKEGGTHMSAVTGAGVDKALVLQGIQQDLGDASELSVTALIALPQNGATRVHAATGSKERFVNGVWLPQVEFTPSLQGCIAQSGSLLEGLPIDFLSGTTEFGPHSLRQINFMAAIMGRCVREVGLVAELGGHTDNTGSGNYELSAARAQVVRNAMIARGVPADALSAVGYGPSKPIADNATAEGRAANQRITVRWAQY